jgi:RNA polymerase sigma factor (sigma-70 family)
MPKEKTAELPSYLQMGTRAKGASLEEIEAVYRHRLAELRRVAVAITGTREAGFDAVQDAFAIAVRKREQFRHDGSLDAWLWRIVVNTALNQTAAEGPRGLVEETLPSRNGSAASELMDVRGAVALLPERQRLVLFLRYYAELDYLTIASALDLSVGTIGATLNQARDNLRRLVESERL